MYLDKAKTRLSKLNPSMEQKLIPCTDKEILELEKTFNVKLPGAFKEFLLWMGKGSSEIVVDAEFFYECWISNTETYDLQRWSHELLNAHDVPSGMIQDSFTIYYYQGYYAEFILLNSGNNPTVYCTPDLHEEDEIAFKVFAKSFSDYVDDFISIFCQPKSLRLNNLEELNRTASLNPNIHTIRFGDNFEKGKF
ncbi:MAG: SMI1/KNR4 family protein, partial [Flavobacteriales bacterium]